MSDYVFTPGQVVAIVRGGTVEAVLRVKHQQHGIVHLDDKSMWYGASGLPVSGSGDRRLTVLNPVLETQLKKRAAMLRIAELATIVTEMTELRNRVSETDLDRAEGALKQVLRGRALALPPSERDAFWARIDERLDEAAHGAVDRMRYDAETT